MTGNVAALPSGITNLEDVQREADVAHQIEQFNAGILNQEHREQKALMDIAKKRKQSEYRQKIIQWLAETDELDEVPTEFAEEVAAYYANHGGDTEKQRVAEKRKKRKEKEEKEETKKLIQKGYWQTSSAPFSSIMPRAPMSTRYTTNTGLLQKITRDPNPTETERRFASYEELPDLKLDDKCRKIAYNVNAFEKVDDEKIRKLLEFISTGKSETPLTNKICKELKRVQGNEEWRAEYMTWEMLKQDTYDSGFSAGEEHGFSLGRNEGIAIGEERGISLGITQAKLETAKNMRFRNIPIDVIAECTGLSVEEIEKL